MRAAVTLFALASLASSPGFGQDLAEGRRFYLTQCAGCHGIRGDGGRGANLAKPTLLHAPTDEALQLVIRRGIPGTEMPRSALSNEQLRDVAAYVRSLGRVAPSPVPGDPQRGAAIALSKGNCRACHVIDGDGASIGPDLAGIGARRSPAYLRASLLEPSAELPQGFLQVRAVTPNGKTVTGVRLNEDTFSIQIRSLDNRTFSFWKSELRALHKDRGQSPMPSYRDNLTPPELDDLVAWLVSLQ